MKALQVFSFEGKQTRVVMKDGQPWWVAKDICDALELLDVNMSVERLDEDEKLIQKIFVSGQNRDMITVNESGMYALIFRSNKPEAKKFRKWITSEVLPAIRKTGEFVPPGKRKEALTNDDFIKGIASGINGIVASVNVLADLTARLQAGAVDEEPDDPEFEDDYRAESAPDESEFEETPELEALTNLAEGKTEIVKTPPPPPEKLYTLEEAASIAGFGNRAAKKILEDLKLIYKPSSGLPYRPAGRALADGLMKIRQYRRACGDVYGYLLTQKGVDLLAMSVPY